MRNYTFKCAFRNSSRSQDVCFFFHLLLYVPYSRDSRIRQLELELAAAPKQDRVERLDTSLYLYTVVLCVPYIYMHVPCTVHAHTCMYCTWNIYIYITCTCTCTCTVYNVISCSTVTLYSVVGDTRYDVYVYKY